MLKILIVDDEELIRKGLKKILGKSEDEFLVTGEAQNGLEALEQIKFNLPDVVITDIKMPKMDGLELVKTLELEYPGIKKIVLSGFEEFNYVRDTMKNGALDYLLKPIDDIDLFEILRKLENEIRLERAQRLKELNLKVKLNESMPLLKEQFIGELLCENKYSEEEIFNKLDYYNITLSGSSFCIFLISIDNYIKVYEQYGADDARLNNFVIRNITEETVSTYTSHISCVTNKGLVMIVSLPEGPGGCIKDIIDEVYMNLQKYTKIRFTISEGLRVRSLKNLDESYNSAVKGMKYRFYNESSGIISLKTSENYSGIRIDPEELNALAGKFFDRLASCVELAKQEQAGQTIGEVCLKLKELRVNPDDVLKMFSDSFMKLRMNYPEFEKSAIEAYGLDYSLIRVFDNYNTLDELEIYLSKLYNGIIEKIGEIRKRKDKKLAEIVKEYVLKHYNEEISLNKMAEITFVNPSYICELFKSQTGENFIDYVTRIRMEKAKVLLRDIRVKTYEVAQMVGYDDATYFSKVFKKHVGVSPTEYRNIIE